MDIRIKQFEEISQYFSVNGFVTAEPCTLINKNLLIYFNEIDHRWCIRNIDPIAAMDLLELSLPLSESDRSGIWRYCSVYYKEDFK
ncbi:hypothetical protein ACTJIJ_19875 [Niabella sp. 22666]|uniref:hypothetical protein n=1 Tax=Niabella sp. 22666 TaxID=3453954 RepID=UPI003F8362C3